MVDPLPPAPGAPDSLVSDQKAGSVLIFPIYTSSATNPSIENTRLNITNTSLTEQVCVHLFAMDGSTCSPIDAFLCLTPNQTTSFYSSDFDPGVTGYIIAVAVDCQTGQPKAFNFLIGDEFVKFASGHSSSLGATAVSALLVNPGVVNGGSFRSDIKFDGLHYNMLPCIVALDSVPSTADGNSTLLILDSIGGNLTESGTNLGAIFGYLFDDLENSFSFSSLQNSCQFKVILSNSFPPMFNRFSTVVGAGHTGWMYLNRTNEEALIGVMINRNSTVSSNNFSQGHNLHILTLTNKSKITVPVSHPGC